MTPRATELVAAFEAELKGYAAERYGGDGTLAKSIRYVLEGPGKRVRPILCLLSADAAQPGSRFAAMAPALAVEFVHCYSLVHDDLPCMDDDDLRRGRPTAHKVFGEAEALLAGDALLTDAFALLAGADALPAPVRAALVHELATAAGGSGMVLGQSLDLHWTARQGASLSDLDGIHLRKTGALLGAAAAMGALAGGATPETAGHFRNFGRLLGLAFQILDDLLDDSAATGKSAGKDQAAGKLTYLSLMSRADARQEADRVTADALAELAKVELTPGGREELEALVTALLERTR